MLALNQRFNPFSTSHKTHTPIFVFPQALRKILISIAENYFQIDLNTNLK